MARLTASVKCSKLTITILYSYFVIWARNIVFFVNMVQRNPFIHSRSVEVVAISFPDGNYMFKVNNRNSRTRCEICSKLIKIPERHQWHRSGIFIVNLEHK